MGEEKKVPDIPYLAFESSQARMERINKKLWIVILVLIVALVGSNAAWIQYENSFMDEVTVTQDAPEGNNNYIGRDGDITNGTADNNN
jgi:hypothetical protein